ncbi:Oxidoreductase [Bordetella tumbae]|uniref:NAD-binding protein n=1 Tax=Bordetella tumbae TaxID=1649139 RepID=UPI0039F01FF2
MSVQDADIARGAEVVGFVGLGAMGGPIVRHLLSQHWTVVVYDLNQEAVRSAAQAGARIAANPQDVARQTGLVFVCLPSLGALRAVLLGDDGVARCGRPCTLVDLSTTGPAFAREMRAALEPRGVSYIDAPITGNVTTAGNGRLGVMCSGPESAFEQAEPVMRVMAGATVLYLGDSSGRAQTLKLLNNLISATGMAVTCEAFILGAKAGLKPAVMLQILNAGEASTNASRNKFASSVLPRRFNYGARMAITAKDISLTVAEAEHLNVPVWIARPVQQLWRYAVSQGGAERDGSALITYLEAWAGIEVRDDDATYDALLPADGGPMAPGACHILCEPENVSALVDHLAGLGWTVALATAEDSTPAAHCIVWVLDSDADISELSGLPELGSNPDHALIVNTCWMPAAQASLLAERLQRQGYGFVDAPLSSRPRDMQDGSATLLVSGDPRHVSQALPVLHALGKQVYQVSARPGDAQRMRHLEEAVSAVLLAVACESYVIGARAGLAVEIMPRILGIETGRTLASATLFPQQVLTRQFDYGKSLGRALRALQLVSEEGAKLQISAWVLESARLLYRMAVARLGPDADVTTLVQLYEQWTGVEVRAGSSAHDTQG